MYLKKKGDKGQASVILYIKNAYKFVRHDIWRITGAEISRTRRIFYNCLKILILAIRGFSEDKLMVKASALTYYTLFAMVPILALILAIGRGFGMQDLIIHAMATQFNGQSDALVYVLQFVDKYLDHAKGGVFVGVGIVVLLWSVMSGFGHVEKIFNDIWQVKKGRAIMVQLSTYFSLMLVLPVLIVASSGLSIFLVSTFSNEYLFGFLSPFLIGLIKFLPYFINWILFTGIFIIIPNTRVKFIPAIIAGVFTGTLFQLFQFFYIKGQVFLSSYNAVYGGFAVIPLLLLWLQISWLIILLGAELSFSAQNISKYEFEADLKQMSRRYKDFLLLSIMTLIIKRFEREEAPYSSEDISKENKIPIRLVKTVLNQLLDIGMLYAIQDENTKQKTYFPAVDINKITVSYLFERLEKEGSENFKIENDVHFKAHWNLLEDIKFSIKEGRGAILLKDL